MSFPYLDETRELDELARKDAGGSFAALKDGMTHYELGGPEDGKPVVLVHGFSVPYFIFDPTFEFLGKSGFRVLRYDLIGRGFQTGCMLSTTSSFLCANSKICWTRWDLSK